MTKFNTDLHLEPKAQTDFTKRVRLNQQKLASDLKSHYDFMVCGAGTSGCVVAARLAADLNTQVRELREARDISQEGLADIPRVHRTYAGTVERGETNISLENITLMPHFLCNAVYLAVYPDTLKFRSTVSQQNARSLLGRNRGNRVLVIQECVEL